MRRPGVRIPLPPAPQVFGLSPRSETKVDFQCDLASVPQRLRLGRPAFFLHGLLSTRSAMKGFYDIQILVSEGDGRLHYSGLTSDLNTRFAERNRGRCPHSSKHRPSKIETAIAFQSQAKARSFERYLKTRSGHEFARRQCGSFRVCRVEDRRGD